MRTILTIIYTLFLSQSFATGQEGELIIYQGDTLQMMSEPLETYLKENEPRERFILYLRTAVQITLDLGKLENEGSVIDRQNIEDIYKAEIKRIIKDFPEVQVFYSRGEPLRESYYGAVIFSKENKRKYAR